MVAPSDGLYIAGLRTKAGDINFVGLSGTHSISKRMSQSHAHV